MADRDTLAVIAHDGRKADLVAWATYNRDRLVESSTSSRRRRPVRSSATRWAGRGAVLSGPMGGDTQIAALVAVGRIRAVFFFTDPLSAHPHDPDIQAVMRVCNVHDVALATNVAGADLFLSSPLLHSPRVASSVT